VSTSFCGESILRPACAKLKLRFGEGRQAQDEALMVSLLNHVGRPPETHFDYSGADSNLRDVVRA